MRILANLLWWLFGGLEVAVGYFLGTLVLACTIVGIPLALQTFKLGLLCLWPFGAQIYYTDHPAGCLTLTLNFVWIVFGGFWAFSMHLFFGLLLFITIIGIPFARQHFKLAALSLAPFGKDVTLDL